MSPDLFGTARGSTPAAVSVLDVRPVTGMGNLRGFAVVSLGPLVIHNCRIIQQWGQRAWVSLPQREDNGRYWPLLEIKDPELLAQVRAAILSAWAERAGGDVA